MFSAKLLNFLRRPSSLVSGQPDSCVYEDRLTLLMQITPGVAGLIDVEGNGVRHFLELCRGLLA